MIEKGSLKFQQKQNIRQTWNFPLSSLLCHTTQLTVHGACDVKHERDVIVVDGKADQNELVLSQEINVNQTKIKETL